MAALLSNDEVRNILFTELEGEEEGRADIFSGELLTKHSENERQWKRHGLVADPGGAAGVIHDFFS